MNPWYGGREGRRGEGRGGEERRGNVRGEEVERKKGAYGGISVHCVGCTSFQGMCAVTL